MIFGCILLIFPALSLGGPTTAAVKRAQQALKAYGIDPGPIDGIMGSRTRTAIKIYQTKNNLRETGILDTETQESLGIAARYQPSNIIGSSPPASPPAIKPMESYAGDDLPPETHGISPSTDLVKDGTLTAGVERTFETVAENRNSFKYHLSRSAVMRIAVLAGLGLSALRPGGWVLLTGASLLTAVLMVNWIGGYFNAIAYGVFACAYITPVLYRLVLQSSDMALIFALFLGTPVLLISKYVFGLSWWMASCNGLAVMTLLPVGYRRILSKRKNRQPYGTLYYRY
jgi:hypothetical protein